MPPQSVTQTRCSCGFLERTARERLFPIKFDPKLNEYSFEDATTGSSMMIYHCPWCGGVASESKRGDLFRHVPIKEWGRLNSLTNQLRSLAEIESALGKPDETAIEKPTKQDASLFRKIASPRTRMSFMRLSDSADVHFYIYPRGGIECTMTPKPKRRRGKRTSSGG